MNDLEPTHQSLPLALSHGIQTAATSAHQNGRFISFKIANALPTWIDGPMTNFSDGLRTAIDHQLLKSKSREIYIICSSMSSSSGLVELDFTASDLPGYKLSSDAKPFFRWELRPLSDRETFKHLLPPASDRSHANVIDDLLTGYCILVVDDSEDSLTYETRLIEKFGGHCETARTGTEALEKALSKHFDVVLMDIKMPALDGNGAMKELKVQRYRSPVVALSAYSSAAERKESLLNGFADYLSKPIVPDQLLKTIARVTNRSLPIVHSDSSVN